MKEVVMDLDGPEGNIYVILATLANVCEPDNLHNAHDLAFKWLEKILNDNLDYGRSLEFLKQQAKNFDVHLQFKGKENE